MQRSMPPSSTAATTSAPVVHSIQVTGPTSEAGLRPTAVRTASRTSGRWLKTSTVAGAAESAAGLTRPTLVPGHDDSAAWSGRRYRADHVDATPIPPAVVTAPPRCHDDGRDNGP